MILFKDMKMGVQEGWIICLLLYSGSGYFLKVLKSLIYVIC